MATEGFDGITEWWSSTNPNWRMRPAYFNMDVAVFGGPKFGCVGGASLKHSYET